MKFLLSILFSLIVIVTTNLPEEVNAREITNIQWNKSVAKGKKLFERLGGINFATSAIHFSLRNNHVLYIFYSRRSG